MSKSNQFKVIVVSGTPCTGKTTLAKKIAKKTKFCYIDVNDVIADNDLAEEYDKKRKCKVVDEKKLAKILVKLIENDKQQYKKDKKSHPGLVIDSHLSHYVPKKYVDTCFITKCDLKTLKKRLEKRKYTKAKVRENLDCEIFDICLNEAVSLKHNVKIVFTDKRVNINDVLG